MSFELGFYKDVLLNKLGAAKDRAAAALRQLDNCYVRLKIVNTNLRDDMPVVRSRSKSKCKHSYEHESKRIHPPRYYDDWSSDDGYETDCSCNAHVVERGRRSHRDAEIYVDGGNADQQNVLIKNCCGGSCKHIHRRRPRSRSVIVVDRPRQRGWHQGLCHPDGHCCIHGLGYYEPCSRCPAAGRLWGPGYQRASQQNYHQIIEDDGKMSFYDGARLSKFLCDQAHAYQKSEEDKKSAREKQLSEAMGILNKMCKPTMPSIFGGPNIVGGGCGCGGYLQNCGIHYGPSHGSPRSAKVIEDELAQVNADLDQLHARALLEAQAQAIDGYIDEELSEELALCSGALQETPDDVRPVRRRSKISEQSPLKSILIGARPKKVNFAEDVGYSPRLVEEIADDEDCLSVAGKTDRCCSRCA